MSPDCRCRGPCASGPSQVPKPSTIRPRRSRESPAELSSTRPRSIPWELVLRCQWWPRRCPSSSGRAHPESDPGPRAPLANSRFQRPDPARARRRRGHVPIDASRFRPEQVTGRRLSAPAHRQVQDRGSGFARKRRPSRGGAPRLATVSGSAGPFESVRRCRAGLPAPSHLPPGRAAPELRRVLSRPSPRQNPRGSRGVRRSPPAPYLQAQRPSAERIQDDASPGCPRGGCRGGPAQPAWPVSA